MAYEVTSGYTTERPNLAIHSYTIGHAPVKSRYLMPRTVSVAQNAFIALSMLGLPAVLPLTLAELDVSVSGGGMAIVAPKFALQQHLFEAYHEMRSYQSLQNGWDGKGSLAPSRTTIESAINFLAAMSDLAPEPHAGVTADGHAEWYWKTTNGTATASFDGRKLAYYVRANGKRAQSTVTFDGRSVPAGLNELLASL